MIKARLILYALFGGLFLWQHPHANAEPLDLSNTDSASEGPSKKPVVAKLILISIDTILITTTTVLVVRQRRAADRYLALYGDLNKTSRSNYLALLAEEENVDSKFEQVRIAAIATGVFLGYTALDLLLFKKIFKSNHPRLSIDDHGFRIASIWRF